MNSLNGYDYLVILCYMAMMIGIGVFFLKFIKGGADYFKASNKLTWWVAGLSSFMSAFSVWMFTGGAGIVYREGLTGAVTLGLTGLATLTGYLLFARLWRRSRVTTIVEYFEERFNLPTHQLASWSYIPVYILYSGASLFALGIFISAALKVDIVLVIWASGVVILIYTLLGGVWAVSVTDTVQFLILLPVGLVLVPLSLLAVGGWGTLVAEAPAGYFSFPSEGLPWYYLVAYLLVLIHGQNTNPIAQRYFSVRNEAEAKKVSLLCSALFVVGVIIWAIPPMAARILYPDLGELLDLPNPDEGAFVVMALRLLPHGLSGLLVAAMFAAAMSSLDSVYNVMAAIISKDIFQRLFNRSISDRALLRVGQVSTLAVGFAVIWISLLMAEHGQGAFSVMMKLGSLTVTPLATPMLLGFLYRRAPGWAGMFAFVSSSLTSAVFAFYSPLTDYLKTLGPWMDFTVSSFTIVLVGATAFISSPLLFKSSAAERLRIRAFFNKLDTPVDEAKEIADAEIDHTSITGFIGKLALGLGVMVSFFVFIPGSMNERLLNLGTGLAIVATGSWLLYVGRERGEA